MPKFGKRSKANLETCHPDLQKIFNEVIKVWDCSVTCGYRGEKEQNEAYDKGNSNARYPQGRHNKKPSLAVDVYPYPINFTNFERMCLFAGYVIATGKSMGIDLIWGRDWDREWYEKDKNNTRLKDYPHFELKK